MEVKARMARAKPINEVRASRGIVTGKKARILSASSPSTWPLRSSNRHSLKGLECRSARLGEQAERFSSGHQSYAATAFDIEDVHEHDSRRRCSTIAAERSAASGDVVTVRLTSDNEVVSASVASEEPLVFQLGSDGIMGNELFQVIDQATRGLSVGEKSAVELKSPDWNPDLLFDVPLDHPEVERLEGRYKNQGGLKIGAVVELANGASAVVLAKTDEGVTLDANSPFASQPASLELELLHIEDGQ